MHKKKLSDSDLGWGESHQTHIGLHEDMLSSWNDQDKTYDCYLFLDDLKNGKACKAVINAIVDGSTGQSRSPKIKTGSGIRDQENLLKLIRLNATQQRRYLTLFELPDGKLIVFLSGADADPSKLIRQTPVMAPKANFADLISNNDDTFNKLYRALLAKPFAILTGTSGSGKTKLAETFANYLRNEDSKSYAIVAVGADWTDNRNVLGFVNHLRDDGSGTGQPIFQSTKVLDLILNADQNPDYPHFLILDEMNLSHVERYFSDFLSAMEQRNGELKLHSEGDIRLLRSSDDEIKVPMSLAYPKNLFVIGTVNIDETTYMFSPKVLDRANVIEFTVSEEDIGGFLSEPNAYLEIEQAEEGIAEKFLELSQNSKVSNWESLPVYPAEAIAAHLMNLFKILKAGRFEFAYRTAKEVNTYMRVSRHLSADRTSWDSGAWKTDLDDQILQKLLPKLHGSMGRIGGLLAALANYCHSGEYKEPNQESNASQLNQSRNQLEAVTKLTGESAKFARSLEKLQSMIQTLRYEQFVSFIQ